MEKKREKKYKVIAKVGSPESGLGNRGFVKYNVNDLLKFTVFLDTNFSSWMYFNVFEYTKEGNGRQLANFTNRNRPLKKFVSL